MIIVDSQLTRLDASAFIFAYFSNIMINCVCYWLLVVLKKEREREREHQEEINT